MADLAQQRAEALARANAVRTGQKQLIAEAKTGLPPREVWTDDRIGALTAERLVMAFPGWGKRRAVAMLKREGIAAGRQVRELSTRQVSAICLQLEAKLR